MSEKANSIGTFLSKSKIFRKIISKTKGLKFWINCITTIKKFIPHELDAEKSEPKRIAIIIHPWLMTPTPFFSIAVGLFLVKKGHHVDFVVDDNLFGRSDFLYKVQILSIKYVLKLIKRSSRVIFIGEFKQVQENEIISDNYVRSLVTQNAVHFMKGELKADGRKEYEERIYGQLCLAKPFIHSFFQENKYDTIHLSGGIYSTSGLYLAYARHFKIRSNTFDAGFGVLVCSTNGIAAQLSDIPYSVSLLNKEIDEVQRESIKAFSLQLIAQRKAGTDAFGFLNTGINSDLLPKEIGTVILLNSVWDSAALGIHNIYSGYVEWLISTIDFLLKNTSQTVTVRQHPGEKFDYQAPSDDLAQHIFDNFGNNNRINFVDCNAKINTYQLIEGADLIICFSSTTGIESAILGKTVIVASNCYYSNESFVFKPKNLGEYHSLIERAVTGELSITSASVEYALLYFYLGQCCNWVFTDFTPMPEDYMKWSRLQFDELYNDKYVKMYLKSIEQYLPISLLISREKTNEILN